MQQHELENLLDQYSPADIRQRFGDRLSSENLAFLAKFEAFDQRLGALSESYLERYPPAPGMNSSELSSVNSVQRPQAKPWFAKSFPIHYGTALVVLAALLVFGFLSLYPKQNNDLEQASQILSALSVTRSGGNEPAIENHDRQLIKALLDRGYFFFEKRTESGYRQALSHFLLAYQIDARNPRSLKYLILASQALGLDADTRRWIQELEALEDAEEPTQP